MNKNVATDFVYPAPVEEPGSRAQLPPAVAHPKSLLDLPFGAARESLLAVHGILRTALPAANLTIYEAGGGSTSFLPLALRERAHITVVDIDEDQIRNNDYAQNTILGDIQTWRGDPESFDLIACYNVIEHVPDVEAALRRFCSSLKPGGLILIGAPNPASLSGVVTKYSPHWFHVWFYKYVRGIKTAGQPGQAPFPTCFHPLVSLDKLGMFANEHGLEIIYRKIYESPRYQEMRDRKPWLATVVDAMAVTINAFIPGNTDIRHGDYHVVLREALTMQTMWSEARARVNHRLAMHLRIEPFRLLNPTPMVSFTFDDIPESAATLGAEMLEAHNATGTFYVAGGLVEAPPPNCRMIGDQQIVALHAKGHEIGCHTFSHARVCDLDGPALSGEIDRNRRYLETLDPSIRIQNFAYPFGYGSFARSRQLKSTFRSSRSIVPGVNRDVVDLQFLQAMPLIDGRIDCAQIDQAFNETLESNGWLIFYTHDVARPPSPFGCSPALLDHALRAAQRRNVEVLNIADALERAGA